MKRLLAVAFTIMSLAFVFNAHASHVAGGNITYQCIGPDEYEITLTLFRDCDGISAPSGPIINIQGCSVNQSLSLNQVSCTEVSQLCDTQIPNSTCNNGSLPGFQECVYTGTVNLSDCDCYTLSYELCCRNPNDNLVGASSEDFYIESTMCTDAAECNNAPNFPNPYPLPYYCQGGTYNLSLGTFDQDGDSLVYSLTNTLGGGGTPIPYQGGFSTGNPIPGITVNQQSGLITFTATNNGVYSVTLLIEEYDDNGVLIGSYIHDMQIIVQTCPPNATPNETGTGIVNDNSVNPNAQVGGPGNSEILICEGGDFCFDLVFEDPDVADSLFVDSNIDQIFPGTTVSYSYNGTTNQVTATVCGSIPPSGPSSYFIIFSMEDNACPFPSTNIYSVTVNTEPSTSAFINSTLEEITICQGDTVDLHAEGGTTFNWVALAGGDPINVGTNFECATCDSSYALPATTTQYEVTSNLAASCGNTDTVTVNVAPDFTTAPQNVTANCVANNVLMPDVVQGSNAGFTYSWDPPIYLNDPTLAEPTASFGPQGTFVYVVTVTNPQGCVRVDTVTAVVGAGSQPDVDILQQNDTTICISQNIPGAGFMEGQVDGGTSNVNDYTWTWTPPTGLASPNSFQTVATPTTTTTYVVTAVDNATGSCQDSDTITINVIDVEVFIDNVEDVSCFGGIDGSFNVITNMSFNQSGESIDSVEVTSPTGTNQTFYNPASSFSVNNLNAGIWTVTVHTSTGCEFENFIQIEQPSELEIVPIAVGQPSCNLMTLWDGSVNINITGGTPQSGNPPYTTNWYFNNINTPSIDNSLQLISLEPGSYIAIVEDAAGCIVSDTFDIVPPDPIAIDTTITRIDCPDSTNGSIIIDNIQNTSGTLNFDWQPNGETTQNLTNQGGGDYTLTITDANGCIGEFELTIPEPPAISLNNTQIIDSDCFPGSNGNGQVSAQATGGWTGNFTFEWFNQADTSMNSNNPTWGNRPPGDYILVATDQDGCVVSDTFTVAENPVIAGIDADPESGIDPLDVIFTNTSTTDSGTVADAFTYIWDLDNGVTFETDDIDTIVQETFNEGFYNVTLVVRNVNGCRDTANVLIEVIPPLDVNPPNVFTPNGDGANDLFQFDVYGVETFYCVVYDRWGKEVFVWEDHTDGWDGTRKNGNDASEGAYTYMYEIRGQDGTDRIGHGVVHLKR